MRSEAWNTGCIFHDFGISSWYDKEERTLVILEGPSLFAANFGLTMFLLRFLASSHTLSPVIKGVNLDWMQLFMVCLASSWAAEASFLALMSSSNHFSTAGRSVLLVMLGSACGSYPMMR